MTTSQTREGIFLSLEGVEAHILAKGFFAICKLFQIRGTETGGSM